jgi:uncharacterized protein (DUF362 family)
MNKKITRRTFIKDGAAFCILTPSLASGISGIFKSSINTDVSLKNIDVAVTIGSDYFENTKKAIDILGGMSRFVPKNSRVLLLGNVWNVPGTFTKPDIFRAIARMCWEAGAKNVTCVSMMPIRNWEQTGNAAVLTKEGVVLKLSNFKDYSQYKRVLIPKGILLKEAEIMNEFFEYDVFINVPICKHHVDTVFSCTMKNLMGLNSYRNNRKFHIDEDGRSISIAEHLGQCIADLNTVIVPTLNVIDATEFIATNGPMGPGKIVKPRKIVAGVDRLALDAYCIALLDKNINDVIKIKKGYEQGLGVIDLSKVRVVEEKR